MNISKTDRIIACVLNSVLVLSLVGTSVGCAAPADEASAGSESAIMAKACDPVDAVDDEDEEDPPAPLTDDQLKELDAELAKLPKGDTAPMPRPVSTSTTPSTPTPMPAPTPSTPAPSSDSAEGGQVPVRALRMCCAADQDSPRRKALKEAAKKRREEYDDLYKKLTGAGVIAAGAGYLALQVKNGKPPTNRELAALGITLAAGAYAAYYTSVIDIERRYKRAYEEAMKLSDEKPTCN